MKKVERKLNKSQLITVWLLIVCLLLTVAYVTVSIVVRKLAEKQSGGGSSSVITDVRYEDGEVLSSSNIPLAYATISEKNITDIHIEQYEGSDIAKEKFGVFREPDENGQPNGIFLFRYYAEGKDDPLVYYPPIAGEDPDFNYESLYSIEGNDGFGRIYYLTYLCSALGNPMFTERIELPTGDDEASQRKRNAIFRDCGITESQRTDVYLTFCERNSKTNEIVEDSEKTILIRIGGKAASGVGYYFMVIDNEHDRPYIYYTNSEYLSYALKSFSDYVKGTVVSQGLTSDAMYGPYLTTNFTSWQGTMYTEGEIKLSENVTKYQNPVVITEGIYRKSKADGGYDTGSGALKFDLEALKKHSDFNRIVNALVGKSVGELDQTLVLTILNDLSPSSSKDRLLNLSSSNPSIEYEYKIVKIESVITNSGERTDGTVGDGDNLVKVTYSYTVGETTVTDCHGVLDLRKLTTEEAAKLKGKTVGENLSENPVVISVVYTRENAYKTSYKYVLRSVDAIFDEDGNLAKTITEKTYVNISYDIYVNGVYSETKTHPIRLADFSEKHNLYPLKDILLGNGVGDYNDVICDEVTLYEYMRDFSTYEISEIKYFTVNEIVVSFAFQNASERNPFYGENLYVNLLENEYKIYGLNAGSCEEVVKLLGGIGTDSNSASGLSGTTVAIGLTADNMEKYGLYAHKIYFEMPRLIYDATEGTDGDSADVLSDFAWVDTIGFTLYISDYKYDEYGNRVRYIGSDMYDVVVKVYTADFDFIELSFVDFWARKSMVMMDITKVDQIKLEFNMAASQLMGTYTFDVDFMDGYSAYVNGELLFSKEKLNGYYAVTDFQKVTVTASDDAFNTGFKKLFGTESADLAWLYQQTLGGGKTNYYPGAEDTTYSAAYFNSAYSILQLIEYVDNLTEQEQTMYFGKNLVMSLHLKVEGQKIGGEEFYYTYDFYRIDDRRIMVSLYKSNADGECIDDNGNVVPSDKIGEYTVSDFYIDAFAFKKLVNAYMQLLDGNAFDENLGYPELR